MKKLFLITLIGILSCFNTCFACGCKGSNTLNTHVCQKACQNVLSLIHLDISLLSPRASIADLGVCGPKTTCCKKQVIAPDCCPESDMPATNDKKSMTTDDTQEKIIPVANIQTTNQPCTKQQSKVSLFRIDLFRIFKFQVL